MLDRLIPVTLREVARAAGVSTASASRALGPKGAVSADLRQRILAAAERLGYVPNLAARSLALRQSGLIGVVVDALADPLIADVFGALERRFAEAGYGVVIGASRDPPGDRLEVLRGLLGRGAEALVLLDAADTGEVAAMMRTRGLPWVALQEEAGQGEHAVELGRRRGGTLAARYLLELGHRRIGVIAAVGAGTAAGALAARGVSPMLGGVVPAHDLGAAHAAMRLFLEGDDPATAVICGSDLYALAALRACLERGIAVPGAVSIVGFGDAPFARHVFPALTTLRTPAARIGLHLAESLLVRLAGGGLSPPFEAPTKLVVRESTGPAPR